MYDVYGILNKVRYTYLKEQLQALFKCRKTPPYLAIIDLISLSFTNRLALL